MAGPGGVQPFVVPLATSQGLPSGLRVGQTFQSVIQGQPGTLSVVIGGTRVPIGDLPQLIPGQVVRGEVLRVDSGLQIRITPQSASPAGPAGTPAPLSQVVATVLESLSALGAAGDAAHVLHQSMPANEAAVRNVLNLFLSDAQTGSDLNALLGTVNAAAQAGALSQRLADSFGLLVSTLVFAATRPARASPGWRHGARTVKAACDGQAIGAPEMNFWPSSMATCEAYSCGTARRDICAFSPWRGAFQRFSGRNR